MTDQVLKTVKNDVKRAVMHKCPRFALPREASEGDAALQGPKICLSRLDVGVATKAQCLTEREKKVGRRQE